MPRQEHILSLQTPSPGSTITIPHLFSPRSYQKRPMAYIDEGGKRAVTVWHRRAGKDLCWLNQTIKQMTTLPFCATYLYIFPNLTQGRRDLWDAKSSPASGGIPFRAHFPPPLVMESSETEMQIILKPMPHQKPVMLATGRGKTKTVGSVFQVMGTDKDSLEHLRGINAYGCVFSEYQDQNPEAYEKIMGPVLMENGGWAAFDYTPKGKNHGYTLYEQARKNQAWFCERLTIADTLRDAAGESGGPIVTPEQIEQMRREGTDEQVIQQEYYCLGLGTRILTADLRWIPIESLLSDPVNLVGVDEHATNGRRKFRTSHITRAWQAEKPCIEIILEGQTAITASMEHPWLVKRLWSDEKHPRYAWIETQNLKVGDVVTHCGLSPWKLDDTWGGGYLAGLFDGEGCISRSSVSFGQVLGRVLDIGINLLDTKGFRPWIAKSGEIRNVGCSLHDSMRLLGSIRPKRLLEKSSSLWEGKFAFNGVSHKRVVALRAIGPQPVIGISTDQRTFIAEGFVTHNCSFDGYLRGTIYGDMVKQARADGRIGRAPWVSSLPVGTMWDIGRRDATSIWFYQCLGSEIRFIDYYSNGGGPGVEHYVKVCREKPYLYGKVMLPHDAKAKGFSAVESTEEILRKSLCRNVSVTTKKDDIKIGINQVRTLFSRFYFDEDKCGRSPNPNHPSGLACLENYHRDWNEEYNDYSGPPVHDQYSHGADALRTGAEAWEEGLYFLNAPVETIKVESIFDRDRPSRWSPTVFAGRV